MYDREWKFALLLFILIGSVYWFVYRPHQIARHCAEEAQLMYSDLPGENARAVKIDIATQECILRSP
jgi:hypothetical protein